MPDEHVQDIPFLDPLQIETTTRDRLGRTETDPSIGIVRSTRRERDAGTIALIITWTFAGTAACVLFGLHEIVQRPPAEAKQLLDAVTPALKDIGTFLSSLFGPLLAFVLGYYFGERKESDSD